MPFLLLLILCSEPKSMSKCMIIISVYLSVIMHFFKYLLADSTSLQFNCPLKVKILNIFILENGMLYIFKLAYF